MGDLEEVKRQASTIEDGRARAMEKKTHDRAIAEAKERTVFQNRLRVDQERQALQAARASSKGFKDRAVQEKQAAANEQRKIARHNLRQKHLDEAQMRLRNSEKAVAAQQARLESKLKQNRDKAERLRIAREQDVTDMRTATEDYHIAEARIPLLEAEEMACLQRLQNSRHHTLAVLEELEGSLGSRGSVAALVRSKATSQEGPADAAPAAPFLQPQAQLHHQDSVRSS